MKLNMIPSFYTDPPMRHGQHVGDKLDPGTKSEGEDDSQHGTMPKCKASLGRTPNHLTLR